MPKLSVSDIRGLASTAGFTGKDLDIAVAVALAESGGDPKSHNSTPPDNSYGLWQINMLGAMGPSRRKQFGISDNTQLFDPSTNASAAYKIFKTSGWGAWSTYTNGKYKGFLPGEVDNSIVDKVVNTVKDANPLTAIPSAINSFGETVFKSVTNLGGLFVGISILSIGVVFLIMSSKTAKNAVNIAANVVPGGNIVKQGVKKAVAK